MSISSRPTFLFCIDSQTARFAAIVLFPTPPLPLKTRNLCAIFSLICFSLYLLIALTYPILIPIGKQPGFLSRHSSIPQCSLPQSVLSLLLCHKRFCRPLSNFLPGLLSQYLLRC